MISTISLDNLLPAVFDDLRECEAIRNSGIWLKDIELTKGTNYLIYAESGTGKSSLCSFIYGSRHDYSGKILFDGENVATFRPNQWSRLRCNSLAYLPQQLSIFPELTSMENIMIKNRLTDYHTEKEILDMLDRLEIREKADVAAGKLSIGQQQRVAIIRALCQPFDFLLLDEPVSHLDARNNANVAAMIAESIKSQNASLIATSVGNHLSINCDITLKL